MDSQSKKRSYGIRYNEEATNYIWERRLHDLAHLLDRTDAIGYTVGRNYQVIKNAIEPYLNIKDALIRKYGSRLDNGQYSISQNDDSFDNFVKELDETGPIVVQIEIFRIKYYKIVGVFSGQQILDFDWMLTD